MWASDLESGKHSVSKVLRPVFSLTLMQTDRPASTKQLKGRNSKPTGSNQHDNSEDPCNVASTPNYGGNNYAGQEQDQDVVSDRHSST